MLNLDTHVVVSLLSGDLSKREHQLIVADSLAISDIVLWELSKLVQLKRLELDLQGADFNAFLRSVTVFPITIEIASKSTELDFESDPADEVIAATSIVENVPLLTRDRRILRSKLVPLAPTRRISAPGPSQ
jgi:PIN domain nuclease of toxin-antitoxin system